jgi:hypothetical protein
LSGETRYLAARLQVLAEPDTVLIGARTRRLVGALFEYCDLGAVEVKGIAGPVTAWQALRPSVVASGFDALRLDDQPANRPRRGNRPAASSGESANHRFRSGRAASSNPMRDERSGIDLCSTGVAEFCRMVEGVVRRMYRPQLRRGACYAWDHDAHR